MSSPSLPDASISGSARILYIEDSYAQSRLILALIAGNRMQADWFATGEEALVAFKANAYDLVLTDHDLGAGMNGLDVARHLRSMDGAGRSIPIVVLTGSNDSKLRTDLFSIGVDDYVTKPALPEELFARIHRLIERHQLIEALAAHEVQLEGVIEQRTSDLLATQRRLQESEFRWKFAIEGSGDGLWDWNIANGTVLYSTRWAEMLGYDANEISDRLSEWEARIHPDDKVETLAAMDAYLKGRTSTYANEHRVLCKDGGYKWVLGRGMVVNCGPDGEPLRMIGTHADIDDRKLAEFKLRDNEFAARLASENARKALRDLSLQKYALDQHAIVATTNVQGTITYANDKFCEVSGYAREELLGRDHEIINSGAHPKGFFKSMYQTISRGEVWHGEVCNRAKDGHLYWLETTIVPFFGDDRKPEQYIAIRADISKRKAAELERQKSEALLRNVASAVPGCIYQLKLRPDGSLCFPYASDGMRELIGVSPQDILEDGTKAFAVTHPDDLDKLVASTMASAKDLTPFQMDWRVNLADGMVRWISGRSLPKLSGDGSVIWHGYIFDVTKQKHADILLRENAQVLAETQRIARIGWYVTDIATGTWTASPMLDEILGVDQFFDRTVEAWKNLILPEFQQAVMDLFGHCLEKKCSGIVAYQILRPSDGRRVWLEAYGDVVLDSDGKVIKLQGAIQDITERKEAELAREKAAEFVRKIAAQAPGCLYQFKLCADGNFVAPYASAGLRELYGLDPEDVRDDATKIFTPVHPDDLDAFSESIKLSAQSLSPWKNQYRIVREDGATIWIAGDALPQREDDGSVLWHGYIRDISERKRIEAAERVSQQRFQDLVEVSSDWVWEVDTEGRYTYVSESVKRVLGYSAEDLIGRTPFEIMAPEVVADVLREFETIRQARRPFQNLLNTNLHKDGSRRDMSTSGRPILGLDGEFLGYRGTDTDVTEANRLAAALADYRDRLEERVREKTEELQQSETTFRKLFEDSANPILLIDGTGTFVECNHAALDLLKMTREQFLYMSPAQISQEFQPDGRCSAEAAPEMIELAYSKGLHRFDWSCKNAEGSEFIVDVSLMPVVIKGQTMLHTTWRDITAQTYAKQEESFRSRILESIAASDPIGTTLEVLAQGVERLRPAALCSILLLSNDGKHLWHGTAPSLPDFYNSAVDGIAIGMGVGSCGTAAFTGKRVIVEDIATHPYWASVKALALKAGLAACWSQPILGASGSVLGTFAIYSSKPRIPSAHDIALIEQAAHLAAIAIEQHRVKSALLESENYNKALFSRSHIPLVVIDPESGRFLDCNQAAIDIYRLGSRDAVLGLTPLDVSAPEQYDGRASSLLIEEHLQTALSTGADVFEWRHRRPDGEIWDAEVHLMAILHEAGMVLQFSLQDITDRRRNDEALRKATALATAANRAKSEFLANMSHEIRTPMNGVIGMVDILRETELKHEQRRMLGTINDSALALLNILNDILDYSKIEAGKLEVERIPTPLREVTESVVQLLINSSTGKHAQISLYVDPALPEWIHSDPTRLRQVLFNLLGNALKFVAKGSGKTALNVHPATCLDGRACVRFCVIDNGIGMTDAVMSRLFQPFTQADESTARKFGGTGLGLSITQQLVELMQGTISVRSTPGAGSEFTVDLPLVTAPMPPGRALTSVTDLSGVEVLAVIPNDCCSSLCRSYLSAAGAKVSVVGDIEAARRHVEQSSGNLVLLLDMAEEFGNATSGEAGNPATMTWPDRVRVVQLAKRGDPGATNGHIEVPARPLLYRDLIRGVAVASGTRQGVDGDVRIEKRQSLGPPAPSVGQSVMTGELILLAEDNETNREVMLAQLRMLGYACEVAEDGVVALAKWRTGRYALLLTDCHMPNMDGFELTTSIRKDELAQGQDRHAPIIAVTANAMQGEAERCRERGMDDYLAKPLRLNELASMLARWLPLPSADSLPTTETIADAVSPAPTFAGVVWDATVLPKMVGNNPAMQRRLLDKFILSAADQVTRIGTAAATGDFATIADVAHSLKSAARTVGALQLGNLCEELEDTRRSGDARLVQTLNEQLPTAFAAASGEIRRHLEQAQ